MANWDLHPDPLSALRQGDPGPFEDFVHSHAHTLFLFFRRLGAGSHRAEDLTQETFLKLHAGAHHYAPRERFGAFCFRVARNVWIDERRRQAGRPLELHLDAEGRAAGARPDGRAEEISHGSGTGPQPLPDPLVQASLGEQDLRLRTAVAELGQSHRQVFQFAVLEGLSYPEIALILEIPVGTVKSRMFHAVRKLRAVLDPDRAGTGEERNA